MRDFLGVSLKKNRSPFAANKKEESIIEQNHIESFLFELEHQTSELEIKIPGNGFPKEDKSSSLKPRDFSFPLLQLSKKDSLIFNDWRKRLSEFQDKFNISLSPFEKNIEVWKHLTFVLHQCDIIVQVVDARNPEFYWNSDICSYVNTIDNSKISLALVTKCDLVSQNQVKLISQYFNSIKVPFILFSSKIESEFRTDLIPEISKFNKSDKILQIGFIGYPNVGKSSIINFIMGETRTAVSSTPGKTKHTQSFIINNCKVFDCPGLVFPKISSKDNLILNGVISLENLTDYLSPLRELVSRVPVIVLYTFYKLKPLTYSELYDFGINHYDEALSFLYSFSSTRKFFTSNHGIPDITKAAKIVLRDFVDGKILFDNSTIKENRKFDPLNSKSDGFLFFDNFTLKA
jgi:large subunit GTPase 1